MSAVPGALSFPSRLALFLEPSLSSPRGHPPSQPISWLSSQINVEVEFKCKILHTCRHPQVALKARSLNLFQQSSCRVMISPPFLQVMARSTVEGLATPFALSRQVLWGESHSEQIGGVTELVTHSSSVPSRRLGLTVKEPVSEILSSRFLLSRFCFADLLVHSR